MGIRKYSFDEHIFSDYTSIVECYWAGFIAADGCITKRSKDTEYNSLTITLGVKDINHLKALKKHLRADNKISTRLMNDGTGNFHKSCEFRVGNREIVKDLYKNYNITPRKSLTLKPPPSLTKRQFKAFLVGYIDGDGCIGKYKSNRKTKFYTRLIIIGTEIFLNKILSFIKKEYKQDIKSKVRKKSKCNAYYVKFEGNYIIPILQNLKAINVPKLERKWNKVQKIQL